MYKWFLDLEVGELTRVLKNPRLVAKKASAMKRLSAFDDIDEPFLTMQYQMTKYGREGADAASQSELPNLKVPQVQSCICLLLLTDPHPPHHDRCPSIESTLLAQLIFTAILQQLSLRAHLGPEKS